MAPARGVEPRPPPRQGGILAAGRCGRCWSAAGDSDPDCDHGKVACCRYTSSALAPAVGVRPTARAFGAPRGLGPRWRMVGAGGLEPPASSSRTTRSAKLSHAPTCGTGPRTRTSVPWSRATCPTARRARCVVALRGVEPRPADRESAILPVDDRALVDRRGLEPRLLVCRTSVLPLSLAAHGCGGGMCALDLRVMSPTCYCCTTPL